MKTESLLKNLGGMAVALSLAACASTQAPEIARDALQAPVTVASAMPVGGEATPPYGFIGFCLRNRSECGGGTDAPSTPRLTAAAWNELNAVNDYVNRLPQIEDQANYGVREYWAYPNERGGDCEDLALEKKRELVKRGWPADALLMATGVEADGEAHAVLVVVTDRGDYVLDNKNWSIVAWNEAPYVWKERQTRERPYMWASIGRAPLQVAAHIVYPPLGAPVPFLEVAKAAPARRRETNTASID